MQTELLEVLRVVARHGSITSAAQALGYTQSAVSRQIAALEAEVGARLLDRLPRGVALTEDGRCLLPHAEAVLDRLATARRELDALRHLGAGRLRVGAFPTAVAALVPRALAAFREQFDLHHLLDERLLVAVPRGHRLARRRTVRLAELAEDPFVFGSATAEDALLRASLPPGFQPQVDIVAADWTGKLGCVAAGLGVALIPALAVRATPADIALLGLHDDDASTRRIFAATAQRSQPPAVGRFIDQLATVAAAATTAWR